MLSLCTNSQAIFGICIVNFCWLGIYVNRVDFTQPNGISKGELWQYAKCAIRQDSLETMSAIPSDVPERDGCRMCRRLQFW